MIHPSIDFTFIQAVVAVKCQGVDTLTDTTSSIGKGFRRSLRKQTNNATTFAREVKDIVDPEDMLKTITRRGKDDKTNQKIIHKPIDWSLSKSFDSSGSREYLLTPEFKQPRRSLPVDNNKLQIETAPLRTFSATNVRGKGSLVKQDYVDYGDGVWDGAGLVCPKMSTLEIRGSFQSQRPRSIHF